MAKKIRFPLEMAEGVEVRTLDELREHFSISQVLMYLENGKLDTWLRDRYEGELADLLAGLDVHDAGVASKVCEIFEVEADLSAVESMEDIQERNRKIELLKEAGVDEKYMDLVDQIAFTQDDLFDLLDDGQMTVYLCGESFSIPLGKEGITYIGINQPTVKIASKTVVDWDAKSITLTDVRFDSVYQAILDELVSPHRQYTIEKKEQTYYCFGLPMTDVVNCLIVRDTESEYEEIIDNLVSDFYEYDDAVFYVKESYSDYPVKYQMYRYDKLYGSKAEVSYEAEYLSIYDSRDKFHTIVLQKRNEHFYRNARFTLLGCDENCLIYSAIVSGVDITNKTVICYFRYSNKTGHEIEIAKHWQSHCCICGNRLFITSEANSSADKSCLYVENLDGTERKKLLTRSYVYGIATKATIDNGKLCVHYHEPSDKSRTWVSEWYDLNSSDDWKGNPKSECANIENSNRWTCRIGQTISDAIKIN